MNGGRHRVFQGIGASPGVATGTIFLLERGAIRTTRAHIAAERVAAEQARLRAAIDHSIEQLEGIRAHFVGDGLDHQAILEAHELMLRDQSLFDEAAGLIQHERINAEWAISRVIARIRSFFDGVSDAYMRERGGDVDFVGERILRNLVGKAPDVQELVLPPNAVVVAHDLSPADTALLARHRIIAFVTEVGGKTSHTSIVARSLDVPAVVGASDIFQAAGTGDTAIVDGLEGSVILRPSKSQLERGQQRAEEYRRHNLMLLEAKALPARTLDGFDVCVSGNIELPGEVAAVLNRGGEAIGLYRTEFMFLGRNETPSEEEHFHTYRTLLDEVGDRAVTVRTLDLGGDKAIGPASQVTDDPNPALGLRAIRYCLQHRPLFDAQIAGLLRAGVRGNLRIMLPMISSIEEVRTAKEIIAEVSHRLQRQGKEHRADLPVGIMIEVPSAVMTADTLAREVDFFSIGTNDLLQYLLAIDRTNERVAYLYQPVHPAVLRTLDMIARAARTAQIPVSVCGEMAGEPEYTPILIGFAFQQLSMNSGAIPRIKRLVRELRYPDCAELLKEALLCGTAPEVEGLVSRFVASKVPFLPAP